MDNGINTVCLKNLPNHRLIGDIPFKKINRFRKIIGVAGAKSIENDKAKPGSQASPRHMATDVTGASSQQNGAHRLRHFPSPLMASPDWDITSLQASFHSLARHLHAIRSFLIT
jgi:hypothetical protein